MWRNLIMVLALTCLVLLGWYAVQRYPSRIEADLEARVQHALAKRGLGVEASVALRDVTLSGSATPEQAKAAKEAALGVSGLNSVRDNMTPPPAEAPKQEVPAVQLVEAKPAEPEVKPSEDVVAEVQAPAEEVAAAVEEAAPGEDAAAPDEDAAAPTEEVAEVAPAPEEKAPAEAAPAAGAGVPGVGNLSPAQCKAALDALLEPPNNIEFRPNTGRLTPEGEAKVAEVWSLLQRCPEATGVIECFHDNYGDPDRIREMTHIRAYNVHKQLVTLGMDKKRFKYLGRGFQDMKYGAARETRALNRRVEFNITVE